MNKTLLLLILTLISCSHSAPKKKTLVLIQGYHLDERSWDEVKNHIPSEQFNVKTLDRLGRDLDHPASVNEIAALSCKVIPHHSVLVAHSYGGAISTSMYGLCPEKVSKIIFVSAIVPKNGELPFGRVNDKAAQAKYGKAVKFDVKSITPRSPDIFFSVMDPAVDVKNPKLPKLYAESMNLMKEVINYDSEQFKTLPKAYIITQRDPVVSVKVQYMFINDAGIKETEGIPTGHYPMIANPVMLADLILKLASK